MSRSPYVCLPVFLSIKEYGCEDKGEGGAYTKAMRSCDKWNEAAKAFYLNLRCLSQRLWKNKAVIWDF